MHSRVQEPTAELERELEREVTRLNSHVYTSLLQHPHGRHNTTWVLTASELIVSYLEKRKTAKQPSPSLPHGPTPLQSLAYDRDAQRQRAFYAATKAMLCRALRQAHRC